MYVLVPAISITNKQTIIIIIIILLFNERLMLLIGNHKKLCYQIMYL